MEPSDDTRPRRFAPDDAAAFRELARTWAASVTVVTTLRQGDPTAHDGFTATAFLTVSIDPPVVLVSAGNATRAAERLAMSSAFAVNLLSSTQREVADAFARPHELRADVFSAHPWDVDASGVALLRGTLGAFAATVRELVVAGDHTVVLGDVTAIYRTGRTDPLVYHNRAYGTFAPGV